MILNFFQTKKPLKLNSFLFCLVQAQCWKPCERRHQTVSNEKVTGKIQNLTWNGGPKKGCQITHFENNTKKLFRFFCALKKWEVWGHLFQQHHTLRFYGTQLLFLSMSLIFFCRVKSGKQRVTKNAWKFSSVCIPCPDLHILVSVRRLILLVGKKE